MPILTTYEVEFIYKLFLNLSQASKDGTNWTTLHDYQDDQSLNEPGSTATWHLPAHWSKETQGWRHIRIQQTGKNASGQTHYLSLSGLELYGSVTGVCEELGKKMFTIILTWGNFEELLNP